MGKKKYTFIDLFASIGGFPDAEQNKKENDIY